MRIALALFTSAEIKNETRFLIDLSDDIGEYFKDKIYGNDIIEIVIGIICVSTYFEPFFIPKKPKYIKDKKTTKSIHTHQTYEIEKCLTYDIKINFDEFKNASNENDREKLIVKEILNSLAIFESMKSKIKDFDLEKFSYDLVQYFKKKG